MDRYERCWGVNLLDTKTGHSKKYLLGKSVWQLYKDAGGVMWVATENAGIYRYDKTEDAFLPLSTDLNEPVNTVMGVLEDNQQNLWFNTKQGLLKLNKQRSNVQLLREP